MKNNVKAIISEALGRGRTTLSEYESKKILAEYGVQTVQEILAQDLDEVLSAAHLIGYPIVLKFCSDKVTHKTEKGLIEIGLRNDAELQTAVSGMLERVGDLEGNFLVQQMVKGARELVIGMVRDQQFGPCVMFGLGGIFTEILNDVSFRVAPIEKKDALEMMRDIRGHAILDEVRGMEAADLQLLADSLIALSNIGLEVKEIKEIDVNPLIIQGNRPICVDALIILEDSVNSN